MHRITQLEERLYLDTEGTYRKKLISMLDIEKARLEALLHQGCMPVQYRQSVQQLTAVQQARTVVDAIWCVYHGPLHESNAEVIARAVSFS